MVIKIKKIIVPKISHTGPKAVLINLTLNLLMAIFTHKSWFLIVSVISLKVLFNLLISFQFNFLSFIYCILIKSRINE